MYTKYDAIFFIKYLVNISVYYKYINMKKKKSIILYYSNKQKNNGNIFLQYLSWFRGICVTCLIASYRMHVGVDPKMDDQVSRDMLKNK